MPNTEVFFEIVILRFIQILQIRFLQLVYLNMLLISCNLPFCPDFTAIFAIVIFASIGTSDSKIIVLD